MKSKSLGASNLKVSTLCFGGNIFGWTVDASTSFKLLDAYTAAGGNFIDTANIYSNWAPGNKGGESEVIIGQWMKIKQNRKDLILATKVGMEMAADQKGLSKSYILRAVEESLKRLQTDYIDLYISHQSDPKTPVDETLEAYDLLIKQGKIRHCGASNYNGEDLREAIKISHKKNLPAYQSLQPNYNLYNRFEFEDNLKGVCAEFKLGVTPYFSLASGFLTGKYRTTADIGKSPRGARMSHYMNERGIRILNALDQVASEYSATPAAIALAWLMNQPIISSAIASATTLEQLQELVTATEIELSHSSMEILNKASSLG